MLILLHSQLFALLSNIKYKREEVHKEEYLRINKKVPAIFQGNGKEIDWMGNKTKNKSIHSLRFLIFLVCFMRVLFTVYLLYLWYVTPILFLLSSIFREFFVRQMEWEDLAVTNAENCVTTLLGIRRYVVQLSIVPSKHVWFFLEPCVLELLLFCMNYQLCAWFHGCVSHQSVLSFSVPFHFLLL